MNKIYLLLSFILFLVIVSMSYNASEVTSYVDGNVVLKVYTNGDGDVFKRIYYIDGIKNRMVEYKSESSVVETTFTSSGRKREVVEYRDGLVHDVTDYSKGLFTSSSETVLKT